MRRAGIKNAHAVADAVAPAVIGHLVGQTQGAHRHRALGNGVGRGEIGSRCRAGSGVIAVGGIRAFIAEIGAGGGKRQAGRAGQALVGLAVVEQGFLDDCYFVVGLPDAGGFRDAQAGGYAHADQHRDDGDDDGELDQRKAAGMPREEGHS